MPPGFMNTASVDPRGIDCIRVSDGTNRTAMLLILNFSRMYPMNH